jgi:predicted dehydrogenase
VAVASSDAAKVHADWPDVAVHATPAELIARADLDLVVIATPNDTHHPLARAALLAGCNVVVDKPFTVALADARELVALARKRRLLLSVFHNRRWDGDFLTLRRWWRGRAGPRRRDEFAPRPLPSRGAPALARERGPGSGTVVRPRPAPGRPGAAAVRPSRSRSRSQRDLTRDGALADDWFHASLRYDRLHVHLHAGMLVAASAPRFAVHGTQGSFVKRGLDAQEDALKAGVRPTWPPQPDWGIDPGPRRRSSKTYGSGFRR